MAKDIRATNVPKDTLRKATKGKLDLPRPGEVLKERIDPEAFEGVEAREIDIRES